jgi:hypothetical protein
MHETQVVHRQFFEARGHRAAFFEPAHTPFNHVPCPICQPIIAHWATWAPTTHPFARWNDGPNTALKQPLPNSACIIATISGQLLGAPAGTTPQLPDLHEIHHGFERRTFVGLPGRDGGDKRDATPVNEQVEFGAESAA